MRLTRTRFAVPALVFACIALAAGCSKSPTSPGTPTATLADFAKLVTSGVPAGAVLPTTLDSTASLVATLDVDGDPEALAIFQSGGTYPTAGLVTVWGRINGQGPDTLTSRSLDVGGIAAAAYSSLFHTPTGVHLVFDATHIHRFTVSGSSSVPAFVDSLDAVEPPVVSGPLEGALVQRSTAALVGWSDAGTDSTVYVQCWLHSTVDTTKAQFGLLVRDGAGVSSFSSTQLGKLPAGAARLSVARYRLVHRLEGTAKVDLACEAVTTRSVTLY